MEWQEVLEMKKIWFLGNCKNDDGGVFFVAIIFLFAIFGILGQILNQCYLEYEYLEKLYEMLCKISLEKCISNL